jgi:hypothetical protein
MKPNFYIGISAKEVGNGFWINIAMLCITDASDAYAFTDSLLLHIAASYAGL